MLLKPKPFSPHGLALVLLIAALATLFLPNPDRGLFHRDSLHNGISVNYLTVAANLSPERHFAGVYHLALDKQGAPRYSAYNRFPPGGYLLLKLAMLPVLEDLEARIYAARMLMLLFFAGTALVAWLALVRLTANPWAALTATFLAFSSYYCLYYSDLVATEAWPALFGVMLTFHGMVVFAQEGRFRQLLVKACLALLLGWQVLGLLLPFVVLGLAQTLISPSSGATPRPFSRLLRSPHLALGLATLCFATAVLSVNLANEYVLLKGAKSVTELPSVQSMRYRVGLDEEFNAAHSADLAWPGFLETQFINIGRLLLTAVLPGADADAALPDVAPRNWLLFWGVIAFCACLLGLAFTRHKSLWAVLALSGFCWALPMRHNVAFHEQEALFYIGIPLTFFSLLLLRARWIANNRLALVSLALVAGAAFVFSGVRVARAGLDADEAQLQREVWADFENIRKLTKGKTIVAPSEIRHMKRSHDKWLIAGRRRIQYALTNRVILKSSHFWKRKFGDVLLSSVRFDGPALLTPENRWAFLYDLSAYDEQFERLIEAFGEPVARVVHGDKGKELLYELRRRDKLLMYVARDARAAAPPFELCDSYSEKRFVCDRALHSRFMLRVTPVDANDLPPVQQWGNEKLDFLFRDYTLLDGARRVVAVRPLPDYPIARIRTGMLDSEGGLLWEAEISFEE